jgi:hypothetical protein
MNSTKFIPKQKDHPVRAISDPIDIHESYGCAETASHTDSYRDGIVEEEYRRDMNSSEKKSVKHSKTPNVKKNGKLLEVEEECHNIKEENCGDQEQIAPQEKARRWSLKEEEA